MPLDGFNEILRQETLGDVDFYSLQTYYFELTVPSTQVLTKKRNFLFPLVINPQRIVLDEPFAIEKTPTLEGGLWLEENGIVSRTLKIKGTTGFLPKPYKADNFSAIYPPDSGWGHAVQRPLPPIIVPDGLRALSGQRHFQFLQDKVFRVYGAFKKDPSTAKDTILNFHNPKDDEHWRVHPTRFTMTREIPRKTLYDYDIDMIISGPAEDPNAIFSEDQSWIDVIKDGIRTAQSAVKLVQGAIQDIVNLVREIESVVRGFGTLINDVVNTIGAVSDFINGVTSAIRTPFEVVAGISNNIAVTLNTLTDSILQIPGAAKTFRDIPDTVQNSLRQIERGFDRLKLFPELFQTSTQRRLRQIRRGEQISTSATNAALEEAAAEAPPGSFQAIIALGSKNLPGDLLKSQSEQDLGVDITSYRSAREHTVSAGESVTSLAARFLGDARQWKAIAVLNNLEAPYITSNGYPGTKKIGDRILIPSTDPPQQVQRITPVLGVSTESSSPERILGTDIKLTRLTDRPGDYYDYEIDVEGGSVDLKKVSGVDNLKQALLTRLRTERGTNQLYATLGVDGILGTNVPSVDRDQILFRIGQAISADPRVVDITRLNSTVVADSITIDMDVQIIGLKDTQTISLEIN